MELRIGNRTTLFAHARLAESAVCFEEPIVTFALDDVLPDSIRTDGHGYGGRQASRREGQADRSRPSRRAYSWLSILVCGQAPAVGWRSCFTVHSVPARAHALCARSRYRWRRELETRVHGIVRI